VRSAAPDSGGVLKNTRQVSNVRLFGGDYRETVACGVGLKEERESDALRTISAFTPVTSQPFGQSSVHLPPVVQKEREMQPKWLMVENCRRPKGLPTLTDGSGFGMRSYCRSGSPNYDALVGPHGWR
jgi:hypothetical protein